jgi:hypothetical protein
LVAIGLEAQGVRQSFSLLAARDESSRIGASYLQAVKMSNEDFACFAHIELRQSDLKIK